MVLLSAFSSVPDLGAELFPWLPVRWLGSIQYDTISKLARLNKPVLIVHSREDTLIRFHHAERNFAAAASFAAKQKDAAEELCFYLRRYNEDLVKEMRNGQNRAIAETQFQFATELTALLFSEEEAELMRRRGKAAQAAA